MALTILVADGDPARRAVIEYALGVAGFDVVAAETAIEARQSIGVIPMAGLVTATDLGRASGWELAREVRQAYPDAAIVVTSGEGSSQWANVAVARAIHIRSPFRAIDVITALSAQTRKDV